MKALFAVVTIVGTLTTVGAALASHPPGSVNSAREHRSHESRDLQMGKKFSSRSDLANSWSEAAGSRNDVYANGRYLGTDPDPRVRANLAKELNGEH